MEMFFYRIAGSGDRWFTNFNGVILSEWCSQHNIKYKIDYFDGYKTGIILEDEKDQVYFHLRWGGKPYPKYEDYID